MVTTDFFPYSFLDIFELQWEIYAFTAKSVGAPLW